MPLVLSGEGLDGIVLKTLGLEGTRPNMSAWEELVDSIKNPRGEVVIGIVGKYVSFEDSYKSLNEALTHGGFGNDVRVVRRWVEAEELEQGNADRKLAGVDGILVPGGFGTRGTGGMVAAAEYARRTGTPYFGICYGFQWAVTEYARNVCGLRTANSTEVEPDAEHKIVYKLQDLLGVDEMGGTMRLGSYPCELTPGSRAAAHLRHAPRSTSATATATSSTSKYESCLTQGGMLISGKTPDGKFVEIAEIPDHPWYVAVQFHPEFKSKPLTPASALRRLRARQPREPARPLRAARGAGDRRLRLVTARARTRPASPRRRPDPRRRGLWRALSRRTGPSS